MITDKSSNLSLRIFSKNLSCDEISMVLDWQPSEKFEKGELFGGRANKKPREESLWRFDLELDKKTLFTKQLEVLIDRILKKKKNFEKIQDKCQIDIFSGYTTYNGQGGFELEAKLMGELSLLKINLLIEFYALGETFDQSVVKLD